MNAEVDALRDALESGDTILVLGAGASADSKNSYGTSVKTADSLAETLTKSLGLTYSNDQLSDVVEAFKSDNKIDVLHQILRKEYSGCIPGNSIRNVFSVPWKRVFSFNIDDVIEKIPHHARVQKFNVINAKSDLKRDIETISNLQIVKLNGSIDSIESGLIFSRSEYGEELARNSTWYDELAKSAFNFPTIFLGTRLEEPAYYQSLYRFGSGVENNKKHFLVVRGPIAPVKRMALSRYFHIIEWDVATFGQFIRDNYSSKITVESLIKKSIGSIPNISLLNNNDIIALQSLYPITKDLISRQNYDKSTKLQREITKFYQGYGPTWPILATDSFICFNKYTQISNDIVQRFKSLKKFTFIVGQAGAGKTTLQWYIVSQLAKAPNSNNVWHYVEKSTSIISTLSALIKYKPGELHFISIDDPYIYADDLLEIASSDKFDDIRIISSARLGEWNRRIERRVSGLSEKIEFSRFEDGDVASIIKAIETYIPAPEFSKISSLEKQKRVKAAKRQILIALRQVTRSVAFDEIIEDEFSGIESDASRILFLAVGLATLARVGVNEGQIFSVFSRVYGDFQSARHELEGLVDVDPSGRLTARHDLYVQHVVKAVAVPTDILRALNLLISIFKGLPNPVIKHVSKKDGQLFKYILNSTFIDDVFGARNCLHLAREYYETLELNFQHDGHYWLQYGIFLRKSGDQLQALDKLQKSVQAYDGYFGRHALALQRFILAREQVSWGPRTESLVSAAVSELEEQISLQSHSSELYDEYPIVTLAIHHVDIMYNFGQKELAIKLAKNYYDRVKALDEKLASSRLKSLTTALLKCASTTVWIKPTLPEGEEFL